MTTKTNEDYINSRVNFFNMVGISLFNFSVTLIPNCDDFIVMNFSRVSQWVLF